MCSSELEKLKDTVLFKSIYETLNKRYSGSIPKDIGDHVVELAKKSEVKVKTIVRWIDKTNTLIANIVSDKAHDAEYALFWIYIHEIVFQLYEHENDKREFNELIPFKKPIIEALDRIRGILDADELVLLKYMRHSHVHIYLDSIWSSASLKNSVITKIKLPKLRDAINIFNLKLQRHGNNQTLMTKYYAGIFAQGVTELHSAARNALSSTT